MIKTKAAGAVVTASSIKMKVNGSLRPVVVSIMSGGSLRRAFPVVADITATASPAFANGVQQTFKPTRVTSNTIQVTPMGGTAPYTYAWSIGGDARVGVDAPASAITTFSALLYEDSASATATCTVTDALGSVATAIVAVDLIHYNEGGSN